MITDKRKNEILAVFEDRVFENTILKLKKVNFSYGDDLNIYPMNELPVDVIREELEKYFYGIKGVRKFYSGFYRVEISDDIREKGVN